MDKRSDFYLLYKESINNLVRHSEAKNALVKITANTAQLNLLIEDDGKGFDQSDRREQRLIEYAAKGKAAFG